MNAEAMRDKIFDAGFWCEECPNRTLERERLPYGEGSAIMVGRSCSEDDPNLCPGVVDYLAYAEEEEGEYDG